MSTVSQSVPNFLSGISQQPDNRKRPGQVKDAVNAFPDFALGMLKRPGGQLVSKLGGASQSGKWFEILRDENEKYIAQFADNIFRVWDTNGNNKMVDMGNGTGQNCDTALVKSKADTLEAKKGVVASKLAALQTAESQYVQELAKAEVVYTSSFATNLDYEPPNIDEFLHTGVIEFPDGGEIYTVNGQIESLKGNLNPPQTPFPAKGVSVKQVHTSRAVVNGTDMATTALTGNGTGLTLNWLFDPTTEDMWVSIGNNAGQNYREGDIVRLTGSQWDGVEFVVHGLGKGNERTNEYPMLASKGVKFYELREGTIDSTVTSATITAKKNAYNQPVTQTYGNISQGNHILTDGAYDILQGGSASISGVTGGRFRVVVTGGGGIGVVGTITSVSDSFDQTARYVVGDVITLQSSTAQFECLTVTQGALADYEDAVAELATAQTAYDTAVAACAVSSIPNETFSLTKEGSSLPTHTRTNVTPDTVTTAAGTGITFDLTTLNGKIHSATVNTAGSGYESGDTFRFFPYPGLTTGATGLSQSSGGGTVTTFTDTDQPCTSTSGTGTGMTVDVYVVDGAVVNWVVNQKGSGYAVGDTFTVGSGTTPDFWGAGVISEVELELGSEPYLKGATPDDIEILSLSDSTFVVNKNKSPRMRNKKSNHGNWLNNHYAQVVIPVSANSTQYTITINGHAITHTSPASAANNVAIASALATAINNDTNAATTGINAQASGPGLTIWRQTDPFTIEVSSAISGEGIYYFTNDITDVSRLPLHCYKGYTVRVINAEGIDIDDMYLEFVTDNNATFGTGQWYESTKLGITYEIDKNTMPHRLVSQADGTFTFEAINWNDRKIGDDTTNPLPSFIDNYIDHVFFYRNRLGFLSGENVILSKAGDLFNFWNTTAQTGTDDDPIDISVAGKKPVFLQYVQPTSVGLVLYSPVEQFILSTDSDLLSPRTAKVNSMSNYECESDIESVSLGISQAFVSKTPLFTKVFELNDVATDAPPLMSDITAAVPELIPSTVDNLRASPGLSMVSLGTKGKSTLYQYRYLNTTKEKRIVSSWYKWDLTGKLLTQFFDKSTFYAVTYYGNSVYLQSYDVTQANEQGFLSLPSGERTDVCLDMFELNPHREYNGTGYENKTRIYLPFDTDPTFKINVLVLGDYIGATPSLTSQSVGAILTPTISGSAGAQYVDIDGNYLGRNLALGYAYTMTVDLPTIYQYNVKGEDVVNDDVSSLILHRLKFKLGLSGPVDYKVSITGVESFTKSHTHTLPFEYNLNNVNMKASSTHVVPVYQRNGNVDVQIIGSSPFPVSLLGMDWEGKINQRFYRRG